MPAPIPHLASSLVGALTCLAVATPLSALTVSTNTLDAAQLHPRGVSLQRTLIIAPEGTETEIQITSLPARLDPASIRLRAPEDSGLRIRGFEFDPRGQVVTPDDARTAEFRENIDRLQRQIARDEAELKTLESRLQQYLELAQSIRTALAQDAKPEAYELGITSWEKYEMVKQEVELQRRTTEDSLKTLINERNEAQKTLAERVAELNAQAGVLRFSLDGVLTEPTAFTLLYQHREAGWQPVYEIRARPDSGTLEWVYKARLWQRTGEDWEQVEISLNSSAAFDPSSLPSLPPLYLDRADQAKFYDSARVRSAPAMAEMAEPPPIAQDSIITTTTTGFAARLPEPVSLLSGAPAKTSQASNATLGATFWTQATPALSTDAWLMAGLTNELGWPILPGEAFFFIDGHLVSRRPLAAVAAGEEFELPLGRNEKIVIERKERLRKESTAGIIDKTRRHEIRYETRVRNRMTVAHKIVLSDRFPFSQNNKIQVTPENPRDVELEEGTGLFEWVRTVDAGAEVVMKTEYTVTYPTEWTIAPEL